jgi:hypothetical protein
MVPRRRELEAASGIAEPRRERLALGSDSSLTLAANGTLSLGANATADESFSAFGVHANLSVVGKQDILGQFEDGGVAVARASVRYLTNTANCIIIDHFSAFEPGLVAPFLYAACKNGWVRAKTA